MDIAAWYAPEMSGGGQLAWLLVLALAPPAEIAPRAEFAPTRAERSRPRLARAVLASVGAAAWGVAAGMVFGLGDRNGGGDPAAYLFGGGAIALLGAGLGAAAGRWGGDGPGDSDRVRPSTVGLEATLGAAGTLDEVEPTVMQVAIAPNFFFSGGGRLRVFGAFGGALGTQRQVDPRPQLQGVFDGQDSTAPVVGRTQTVLGGGGFDLAVALPYPLLRRSPRLGPAELRFRPQVQVVRERVDSGQADARMIERTMLLPLTAGARWVLAPRQRFTVYFGPRFDVLSYSDDEGGLRRGGVEVGPLYGEAWYDLDVPHSYNSHRSRARVNSMLSVGYIHSRFDGRGINFSAVIGFFGSAHVRWVTRVRPRTWPVALQAGAGLMIGTTMSVLLQLGAVLPDWGRE